MARTLGVICARGGSKGLPGKNLMEVNGKSMIQHSIEQARGSKLLTRWVVSTDSEAIAEVAKAYAPDNVPFLRPAELAQDDSRIEGALQHALKFCEDEEGEEYDYICMLLNTMPLRTSFDIDSGVAMMEEMKDIDSRVVSENCPDGVESVISVQYITHPYELRDSLWNRFPQYVHGHQRGDDFALLGNGAVVVVTKKCLLGKNSIWGDRTRGFVMPAYRSIDIDTPDDLLAVEAILKGVQHAVPHM